MALRYWSGYGSDRSIRRYASYAHYVSNSPGNRGISTLLYRWHDVTSRNRALRVTRVTSDMRNLPWHRGGLNRDHRAQFLYCALRFARAIMISAALWKILRRC